MPDDWALDPPLFAVGWCGSQAGSCLARADPPGRRKWEDGLRHWWAWLVERDELGPQGRRNSRALPERLGRALGAAIPEGHLRHFCVRSRAFVRGSNAGAWCGLKV